MPYASSVLISELSADEEKTIKEAVQSGWQGKSLRVDGPWIENQEVMCKAVLWEDGGAKTPATLIHFRLTNASADGTSYSGVPNVSLQQSKR